MLRAGEDMHWVEVYRSLRHRTLNRLQVASGWAQLGEGDAAREALEAYLLEERRLSALLGAANLEEQEELLQLLAECERHGRALRLSGDAQMRAGDAMQRLLAMLRAAVKDSQGSIEIAMSDGRAQVLRDDLGGQ